MRIKKNLKLVLVYPSYLKFLEQTKFRRFGIYAGAGKIPERPHIGLAYLSEYLLTNGFDHEIIDMNLLDTYAQFKSRLRKAKPDIIGMTLVTPGYLKGYQLIKRVKKDFPRCKIIVGGPHIGLRRENLLKDCPEIDVGFISEAEQSLVDYLKHGANPAKANGVVYRRGRKICYRPPKLVENIDRFPFPRYSKFDLNKYSGIALYTSRGCPFRCVFCTVDMFRRNAFRPRSNKKVVEEIKYWYQRGQKLFPVEDDNFTFDIKRIFKLCDAIEKLGYPDLLFALGQGLRADRTTRRLLKRMYKVGFKYATIAVEAGNNRMLKNLNKAERIETIERAIKNACDIGYEVRLLFVVGAKGETWKDVEDSFKISKKYPVMYSRFNNLLPIPGTALFDWVKQENLFIQPPEKYLNSNFLDYTQPFYETPELTAEERTRALIVSDQINQYLFYKYLNRKLKMLGPLKYPISFLASRKFVQILISEHPLLYKTALQVRSKMVS